jgi:Flp pilus assembly protein TadD
VQGRDPDGEKVLRQALQIDDQNAAAHHALGLLLVRRRHVPEAVAEFARAAAVAPDNVQYAYVYGVGLNSVGRTNEALDVLRAAYERQPGEPSLLQALATISRDAGRMDDARRWATALAELTPWDEGARRFRDQLAATP